MRSAFVPALLLVAGCLAPRAPRACELTGQLAGPAASGRQEPLLAPPDERYIASEATIRVLSLDPLRYELIDAPPGAPFESWAGVTTAVATPQVAAFLARLPFGEIVGAHFEFSPVENRYPEPPPVITRVHRLSGRATRPWLLAARGPSYAFGLPDVAVYSDGRATVAMAGEEPVSARLSPSLWRDLLTAFARADFDRLPEDAADPPAEDVILACARYQQVAIAAHERALAPVLEAFARVRAEVLAQREPALDVQRIHGGVRVEPWPGDALPLATLDRLKYRAPGQRLPLDPASPLYTRLPAPIAAELRARQLVRELTGGLVDLYPVTVMDRGVPWQLGLEGCPAQDQRCPGSYLTLTFVRASWQDAPAWAPDLSRIDEEGLFLHGQDALYRTLSGAYRQGDTIYVVRQVRRVPPAKR